MINYAVLADRLEAALRVTEAIGVVITSGDGDAPPAGTAEASCVHWSSVLTSGQARRTAARDHAGCSVGRYVHGMSTLEQTATAEDTATLVAAGWVELGPLEPGSKRLLGYAQALGHVADRAALAAHERDGLTTELLGIGRSGAGHGHHPSCRA